MGKRQSIWSRETLDGEREFRTITKVLFSLAVAALALGTYLLLNLLGTTEKGFETIVVLAYGVGVLMVVATLLVIVISLIDYLRSLE